MGRGSPDRAPFLSGPEGEAKASPGVDFFLKYRPKPTKRDLVEQFTKPPTPAPHENCERCGSPLYRWEVKPQSAVKDRCSRCRNGQRMSYVEHRMRCGLVFAEPLEESHFEAWQSAINGAKTATEEALPSDKLFQNYKAKSKELNEQILKEIADHTSKFWAESFASKLSDPLQFLKLPVMEDGPEKEYESAEETTFGGPIIVYSPVRRPIDGEPADTKWYAWWLREADYRLGVAKLTKPGFPTCKGCREPLDENTNAPYSRDFESRVCGNCHGYGNRRYEIVARYGGSWNYHKRRCRKFGVRPMDRKTFENFYDARNRWLKAREANRETGDE